MKKILLLLFLSVYATRTYAQSPGDSYAFKSPFPLQRFDSYTQTITVSAANIYRAQRGDIFRIQSTQTIAGVSGFSIIFWDFKNPRTQPAPVNGVVYHDIDSSDNGVDYFISASDLAAQATNDFRKPHGAFKIDALVLPIKLRFENKQPGGEFDFAQSISIGPTLAFQKNHGGAFGKTSTAFLVGFNITNISADNKTVPGVLTSRTTLLGLTPFLGITHGYGGISFSLLLGMDILTGEAGKAWAYRKSPWLGVSIGTALFSPEKKNGEQ